MIHTRPLAGAALIALCVARAALAADAPPTAAKMEKGEGAQHTEAARVLPADKVSVTRHSTLLQGRALTYRATAGVLPVAAPGFLPEARIFYISYELEGGDKKSRPLAFAFNGGPGAASAYLHLGALGPRRLRLNDDGTIPPPPPRFADNALTWLVFTDLVFIDPGGTGYSRSVDGKDAKGDESAFFGTRADNATLGRFMRLYLSRNERWLSPKFLIGESYGGFRVAALAELLQSEFGIGLNGAVLISPVLDFGLNRADRYRLLPWALKLPSLSAIALFHGKSALPRPPDRIERASLAEVERWSLEGYLTGLARGDGPGGPAAQEFIERTAGYTGLAQDLVRRRRGRIPNGEFAKQLLGGTGRVVSFYDGSVTGIDPDPESPSLEHGDRTLAQLNEALLPALNAYLREELKFETDLPYLVLNPEVGRQWNWHGRQGGQGFASAADELKDGMTFNPHLRVLIAHGLFDLVTPYFASAYAVSQMALDAAVRPNLQLKTYAAGHMIYTHAQAREALFRDAEAFFQDAGFQDAGFRDAGAPASSDSGTQ